VGRWQGAVLAHWPGASVGHWQNAALAHWPDAVCSHFPAHVGASRLFGVAARHQRGRRRWRFVWRAISAVCKTASAKNLLRLFTLWLTKPWKKIVRFNAARKQIAAMKVSGADVGNQKVV
jgi:hypothetical protein